MSGIRRYLRLLPAVVIVGTGLLAIKGVDIARAAQAVATADPDGPDNSGLAPSMAGGMPTKDLADDDTTLASAAEVDVLSSLTRRRAELDARERALNMRENLLSAGEGRVDQKIAALQQLQTQIQALLAQRDAKQDAQIASLVKTYSTMKSKDAARIFESLSDDVLLPVAKGMKSDVLAPVLAAMNPDAAQKLTVKLAALLKLPDTKPAMDCPAPTAAATPGTDTAAPVANASAAPAPLQTASLNPPVTIIPPPVAPTPTATPAATPPPAAAPAAATPPAAIPPATPPARTAATPPPHKPAVHHPAKPAKAAAARPAKPETASATPPPKPVATTAPAQPAAVTPPPAKPATQAASGPPTPLSPPTGG